MQAIKVTMVMSGIYRPNLDDPTGFYRTHGVTTVEDAIEIDEEDFKSNSVEVEELCGDQVTRYYTFEVVEVPDEPAS